MRNFRDFNEEKSKAHQEDDCNHCLEKVKLGEMMNTQLSWLIPILGSIYLLSIHILLLLGQQNRWQHFFANFFQKFPEFRHEQQHIQPNKQAAK